MRPFCIVIVILQPSWLPGRDNSTSKRWFLQHFLWEISFLCGFLSALREVDWRLSKETRNFPQETRNVPHDASILCVDKRQRLSQRMACRHRDRDNHHRGLVVGKCFETTLFFGFDCIVVSPRLAGWKRRSRSSSHKNFSLPSTVPVVEHFVVAAYVVLLLEILLFLQDVFCVCRQACEFPHGECSFRTPH